MQIKITANQTSTTTTSIQQTIFQQTMHIFPPKTATNVPILVLQRVTHPVAPAGNEGDHSGKVVGVLQNKGKPLLNVVEVIQNKGKPL